MLWDVRGIKAASFPSAMDLLILLQRAIIVPNISFLNQFRRPRKMSENCFVEGGITVRILESAPPQQEAFLDSLRQAPRLLFHFAAFFTFGERASFPTLWFNLHDMSNILSSPAPSPGCVLLLLLGTEKHDQCSLSFQCHAVISGGHDGL